MLANKHDACAHSQYVSADQERQLFGYMFTLALLFCTFLQITDRDSGKYTFSITLYMLELYQVCVWVGGWVGLHMLDIAFLNLSSVCVCVCVGKGYSTDLVEGALGAMRSGAAEEDRECVCLGCNERWCGRVGGDERWCSSRR